jgi:hypothetical protein
MLDLPGGIEDPVLRGRDDLRNPSRAFGPLASTLVCWAARSINNRFSTKAGRGSWLMRRHRTSLAIFA